MTKQKIVFFDIDHTLFNTPLFKDSNLTRYSNYAEVADVLIKVKNVATIGIYSEGDLSLQTEKLTQTHISEHFLKKNIYIFDKKLEKIQEIFAHNDKNTFYLIDDRQRVLQAVKAYNPAVHTIWIRRGIYADEIINGFTPDKTVETLRDILGYITKASE